MSAACRPSLAGRPSVVSAVSSGGPVSAGRASWLVCSGCGCIGDSQQPFVARCPCASSGDDIDHVMTRVVDPAVWDAHPEPEVNPFVRYRSRFHAYHVALGAGWSDGRYVDLVRSLDRAVADVEGHGFSTTPIASCGDLDSRVGFGPGGGVWVKDETGNVSGSHKARHLMGVMLELQVAEALGAADPSVPLAIASCGNAALAAAVVARAADRRLRVFVPPSAEPAVIARLQQLQAEIVVCERVEGESGDPTYLRLLRDIEDGAVPFTCQGNLNGLVIEGGATLAWELIDQLPDGASRLDRVVIQVGGGAFASSQALAFDEAVNAGLLARSPRLDTVQTRGGYPLVRAYRRVLERLGLEEGATLDPATLDASMREMAGHRSRYMWAWETEPQSIAHGILDDETYDWRAVVHAMLASGGRAIVVDEATLVAANDLAGTCMGIDADHTGSAGLAGLMQLRHDDVAAADETVAVVFSGMRRHSNHTVDQPDLPPPQEGLLTS